MDKNLASGGSFERVLLDALDEGVIALDYEGCVLAANHSAETMFGYAPRALPGRNVRDLFVECADATNETALALRLQPQPLAPVQPMYWHGQRCDGSVFPLELVVTQTESGAQRMHVCSVRAASRSPLRVEPTREALIESLRVSNRELDDFALIASHDLKEPLRGLANHARYLEQDFSAALGPDGLRRITRMRYLCDRMEALIDDLLHLSRLDREALALHETDLNPIIHEIVRMMESTLEENDVQVEVPQPLPRTQCDRVRVQEVFRNLISNAVKYNHAEHKRVEIGHIDRLGDKRDVFYVRDNGDGIAPQFRDEVFALFRRLGEEPEDARSTGVGLCVVKANVERHHGEIWLESIPGQGTTFYFTLAPRAG